MRCLTWPTGLTGIRLSYTSPIKFPFEIRPVRRVDANPPPPNSQQPPARSWTSRTVAAHDSPSLTRQTVRVNGMAAPGQQRHCLRLAEHQPLPLLEQRRQFIRWERRHFNQRRRQPVEDDLLDRHFVRFSQTAGAVVEVWGDIQRNRK